MARPALRVDIRAKDQRELRKLLSGGAQQGRLVLRALALLQLAKGVTAPRIASVIPLTAQAVRTSSGSISRAVWSGRCMRSSGRARPKSSTTARSNGSSPWFCSRPPEGRARWTARLVAEEAVRRKIVPKVGRESIRVLLLSHDLKPWREENVGGGRTR